MSSKKKSISLLTDEDIQSILHSYPPLTEEEFRYSLIKQNVRGPDMNDPSLFIVSPVKTNPTYHLLSTMTHKCYVNHRIPQIPNQAPSIEQWYQELKVYRSDLIITDEAKRHSVEKLMTFEPNDAFFEEANANFASSMNARRRRKCSGKPVYYYFFDPGSNKPVHLTEPESRQLYCKKYEQSIMFPKSPARPVFEKLWRSCMTRCRDLPIVMRSYGIVDALTDPTNLSGRYHDYNSPYGHAYCLAEMLVNFPNLENCIWNKEVPVRYIPNSVDSARPKIVYQNPHAHKVYACDLKGEESESSTDSDEPARLEDDIESFLSDNDQK